MFETLIPQYLNELVESEVGNFASPEAFQVSVKVQRLGRDKVKSSTEVCGKFEVPIFALVRDMPEQTDDFTETPPPIAGAFDFTAQGSPCKVFGVQSRIVSEIVGGGFSHRC